jgi:hypothetical protein
LSRSQPGYRIAASTITFANAKLLNSWKAGGAYTAFPILSDGKVPPVGDAMQYASLDGISFVAGQ